ncbi:MAG: ABC transporter ATP-binding protein [Eubacteriales bacterium]
MIKLKNVSYDYTSKAGVVHAVRGVSAVFSEGRMYAITGRSGSGKTTLLSLIAGLDVPLSGSVIVNGADLVAVDRDRFRRTNIGMIFQSYYLLPQLTAAENIKLAFELTSKKSGRSADELLNAVGLTGLHGKKRVTELSGGEQQRVAIARAIAADPPIILADEPTGNLDNENSRNIIGLLASLAHDKGKCVIIVTHSDEVAAAADERLNMSDGSFV